MKVKTIAIILTIGTIAMFILIQFNQTRGAGIIIGVICGFISCITLWALIIKHNRKIKEIENG